MSRGLAPVRVVLSFCVKYQKLTARRIVQTKLHVSQISVPFPFPKYVEQIIHIEWTRARAEFDPKVPASYIFWRCSSLKTSAVLGLLPMPCVLSDFCLLF